MPLFDHAVIARSPDQVPRLEGFVDELAGPAGLSMGETLRWDEGQRKTSAVISAWRHDGDHLCLQLTFDDGPRELEVLLRPRDEAAASFLRTRRWNVSYRGEGFDDDTPALLQLVGEVLEAAAVARELDADALHARYFTRPNPSSYLEVSPGKKLYLRVTEQCDENCLFCNATEGNANVIPGRQDARELLKSLPVGALNQVIFTGGEPALLPSMPELVELAWRRGAKEIILQTNGVLLAAPGALERYLPFRDRLGIGFSLHAHDAALSDLMTGVTETFKGPLTARFEPAEAGQQRATRTALKGDLTDRFARKIEAIDRCVALGIRAKITCVVMRPNLAQVPSFARWCFERWGRALEQLQFSYAMPRGNAWMHDDLLLRFSECVAPFAEAFAFGQAHGMPIETSQTATVPPCVMPDHLEYFHIYGDFSGKVADAERAKPIEVCDGCAYDRVCPGVWKRYLDRFGMDELKAVTNRPPPAIVIDDFMDAEVLDLSA